MVQDLLTLARRGVAKFEIVNLNPVIPEFLGSPEFKKQQSFYPKVELVVHLADSLDSIKGPAVHLSKTVMNLLANALDATAGEGTVTLNRKIKSAPITSHGERSYFSRYQMSVGNLT